MLKRNSAGLRCLAIIFLVFCLSQTMLFAQTSGVTEVKLSNGLTVLLKEAHAAPVFTAQVWFKVGSRNEYNGITGSSHLLEHMLFNSSKNYKKGEITSYVRLRGGIDNAATWTDFTYYWELLSKDHLEFALETLAEKMGNALLLEDELKNEKGVVVSELLGYENDPDRLLYNNVVSTAIMAHPYHWSVGGWIVDVENVSRDQLYSYYRSYYHPNNATVVLVGDFDTKKAIELVKKHFGSIKSNKLPPPIYTTEPDQRGERSVILRREGRAERVLLAYKVPGINSPDTPALMVLDQILTGGKSGRLYQALVENQFASGVWSTAGTRKDPALFMVGATARQGITADKLEEELNKNLDVIKTTPPSEEELQAAKNQLEASFIFQNDSVSDLGEQLGYYSTIDTWKYLDNIIPSLKAVTAQQVRDVAAKYLVRDTLTIGKFIPTENKGGAAPQMAADPLQKKPLDLRDICKYDNSTNKDQVVYKASSVSQKDTLLKPHRVVLDNGIVIIVQENHSNPTFAITGNIKAGSAFDTEGKSGIAELTAEMLSRGTKTRSALDIAKSIEYVGAGIEASASTEAMTFGAKALKKDFTLVLDVLSDEIRNPVFPEDQFQKAKGEMESAIEESKESTSARASQAFYNSVFPKGHPYHALNFDDSQKELKAVTREDLISFHEKYYRPDNTIITVVGDVTADEVVSGIKKYFSDWTSTGPAPKLEIPDVKLQENPKVVIDRIMDKSEASVLFGHVLGISRKNPDYYAVKIMNQILGGGGALSSILGNEIREKQGLVYDVYSTFDATLGGGPWYARLGTSPKNIDKAVQTLKYEIEKFKQNGASKEQFNEAREFIVGVFPIALETNSGISSALLSAEFYGLGLDYLNNYASIYRSVTLDQVNAAAKKYLHLESATLVIAGPYDKKEK